MKIRYSLYRLWVLFLYVWGKKLGERKGYYRYVVRHLHRIMSRRCWVCSSTISRWPYFSRSWKFMTTEIHSSVFSCDHELRRSRIFSTFWSIFRSSIESWFAMFSSNRVDGASSQTWLLGSLLVVMFLRVASAWGRRYVFKFYFRTGFSWRRFLWRLRFSCWCFEI